MQLTRDVELDSSAVADLMAPEEVFAVHSYAGGQECCDPNLLSYKKVSSKDTFFLLETKIKS